MGLWILHKTERLNPDVFTSQMIKHTSQFLLIGILSGVSLLFFFSVWSSFTPRVYFLSDEDKRRRDLKFKIFVHKIMNSILYSDSFLTTPTAGTQVGRIHRILGAASPPIQDFFLKSQPFVFISAYPPICRYILQRWVFLLSIFLCI